MDVPLASGVERSIDEILGNEGGGWAHEDTQRLREPGRERSELHLPTSEQDLRFYWKVWGRFWQVEPNALYAPTLNTGSLLESNVGLVRKRAYPSVNSIISSRPIAVLTAGRGLSQWTSRMSTQRARAHFMHSMANPKAKLLQQQYSGGEMRHLLSVKFECHFLMREWPYEFDHCIDQAESQEAYWVFELMRQPAAQTAIVKIGRPVRKGGHTARITLLS
jgi:hypothetical protein